MSREFLLNRKPAPVKFVLDGQNIFMRRMLASEKIKFELSLGELPEEQRRERYAIELLLKTLCDEQGERLFKDEEYEVLGNCLGDDISKLFTFALTVNGVSTENVDERTKN